MKIAIHQPYFLPWRGYIEKLQKVDRFIFLDHVKFSKNNFENRNRLIVSGRPNWLTVPVKKPYTSLDKQKIDYSRPWQRQMLSSLEFSYSDAKNFANVFAKVKRQIELDYDYISDLSLKLLGEFYDLEHTTRSSNMELQCTGSNLILEICKNAGATKYLSGPFGRKYLDLSSFAANGIDVEFFKPELAKYSQVNSPDYIADLSFIDYQMNLESVNECN